MGYLEEKQNATLQLDADDRRWDIKPPYKWLMYKTRYAGHCWYCGAPIPPGSAVLYSPILRMLGHVACKSDGE